MTHHKAMAFFLSPHSLAVSKMTAGVDRVWQKQLDKGINTLLLVSNVDMLKTSLELALKNKISNIKNILKSHILSFFCWRTYTCVIPIIVSWRFLLMEGHLLSKQSTAVPTDWRLLLVSYNAKAHVHSFPARYHCMNELFPPALQHRFVSPTSHTHLALPRSFT